MGGKVVCFAGMILWHSDRILDLHLQAPIIYIYIYIYIYIVIVDAYGPQIRRERTKALNSEGGGKGDWRKVR